ncbi:unnamed protein product [Sphagnum jensenii]|uniref:Uncharacterized protein n=1 Tax=Sphagnum jensenii TaxID=128206 RepID=A0ABP1A3L5_9BRYO
MDQSEGIQRSDLVSSPVSISVRQISPIQRSFADSSSSLLLVFKAMIPGRHLMEVEVPRPMRYILGAVIMMLGVVLPVGYMMFRTKRVPSSSSTFTKQTELTERWRDS